KVKEIRSGTGVEVGVPFMLSREGQEETKVFPCEVMDDGRYVLFTQFPPDEFGLTLMKARGPALRPLEEIDYTLGHVHDHSVTSVCMASRKKVDEQKLSRWLTALLHDQSRSIYRMKGILDLAGKDTRCIVHGVHSLLNFAEDRRWEEGEDRNSQLVFIGRNLENKELRRAFRKCLA